MKRDARYIKNRREMRKRKRKMRAYICMGILCFACIFSFLVGKNVGTLEAAGKEQAQVTAMEDVNQGNAGKDDQYTTEENTGDEAGNGEDTGGGSDSNQAGGTNDQKDQSAGSGGTDNDREGNSKNKPQIDKSGILLVNKDNKLPEDYEVTLKKLPDRTNQAAEEAYEPMCDMLSAARKEGLELEVCSSYRSVERQKELFEEDMKKLVFQGYSYLDAYEEVARETMPPGYSEHSTGLAFDIVSLGYQMLDEKQEDTEENKWLQEHCAEFGFILRYPKGKEDITGVAYESWHFRYVGVEAAEYIMKNEITLEEFLAE